ncbi:MAG: hypothetical protein C5B49_15845 [Bdellovibrio sp.]|nr:MAG: hypothetical protein C5B49_15845 [Bdellovibrio sp.]
MLCIRDNDTGNFLKSQAILKGLRNQPASPETEKNMNRVKTAALRDMVKAILRVGLRLNSMMLLHENEMSLFS